MHLINQSSRCCFASLTCLFAGAAFLAALLAGADSIRTADGKTDYGKLRMEPGTLSLTATNGTVTQISISNLETAIFADDIEVLPGEQNLLPSWNAQDIGVVAIGGGVRQETNSFTVRSSGTGINPKGDGCHFVFQQMTGDAVIIAQLTRLDCASKQSQAALAMRQTLGPESAEAAIVFNQSSVPAFQYRVSRKRPNPWLKGDKIALPCWLKLERKANFFVGSVSTNGKDWKVVGGQNVNLGPSRNHFDQWYVGLATTSQTNKTFATAEFTDVQVHLHGVKAETFVDAFKTPTKTVILPEFSSGTHLLSEERPAAVRWTGEWTAPHTDSFTFSARGPEKAKIWINDKLVSTSPSGSPENVALKRGEPAALRVETEHSPSHKFQLELAWSTTRSGSGRFLEKDLIPFARTNFSAPAFTQPSIINSARSQMACAGVVLKDGSALAGVVQTIDDSSLLFVRPANGQQKLSLRDIARVQFRSLSPQLTRRIRQLGPGLLLVNGDLIEGELKKLDKDRITISSVIFGLKTYDVTQAAAMVLRSAAPEGEYLVRTLEGSAVYADQLHFETDELRLHEPILGSVALRASELLDLRKLKPGASKQ